MQWKTRKKSSRILASGESNSGIGEVRRPLEGGFNFRLVVGLGRVTNFLIAPLLGSGSRQCPVSELRPIIRKPRFGRDYSRFFTLQGILDFNFSEDWKDT